MLGLRPAAANEVSRTLRGSPVLATTAETLLTRKNPGFKFGAGMVIIAVDQNVLPRGSRDKFAERTANLEEGETLSASARDALLTSCFVSRGGFQ